MGTIPQDTFIQMAQDSDKVFQKIENFLERVKPESIYFTEINAERTVILIIDIQNAEMIDVIADKLTLEFGAKVQVHPALIWDDMKKSAQLQKGLSI